MNKSNFQEPCPNKTLEASVKCVFIRIFFLMFTYQSSTAGLRLRVCREHPSLPPALKGHLALGWRRVPGCGQRERAGQLSTARLVMLSCLLLPCMVGQVLADLVLLIRRLSLDRMLEEGNWVEALPPLPLDVDARWVRERSRQGGARGESGKVCEPVENVARVVPGEVKQTGWRVDGEAGVKFWSLPHTHYHRLQQRKDSWAKLIFVMDCHPITDDCHHRRWQSSLITALTPAWAVALSQREAITDHGESWHSECVLVFIALHRKLSECPWRASDHKISSWKEFSLLSLRFLVQGWESYWGRPTARVAEVAEDSSVRAALDPATEELPWVPDLAPHSGVWAFTATSRTSRTEERRPRPSQGRCVRSPVVPV